MLNLEELRLIRDLLEVHIEMAKDTDTVDEATEQQEIIHKKVVLMTQTKATERLYRPTSYPEYVKLMERVADEYEELVDPKFHPTFRTGQLEGLLDYNYEQMEECMSEWLCMDASLEESPATKELLEAIKMDRHRLNMCIERLQELGHRN